MTSTISEIMNTELRTLTSQDSLWDAVQLMNQYNIRHIPVVENDKLVGLLTQRDALLHMHLTEEEQKKLALSTIMTTNIATIEHEANIRQAALFLQKHKIGCLPIVENNKLIGIVTDSDFVAVAINLLEIIESSEPMEDGFN